MGCVCRISSELYLSLLRRQDPNSLSNLDQDLPNNMIHQVRIKSLPQEWLWCETWCDDASKQYAKTIDLVSELCDTAPCRLSGGRDRSSGCT